MAIELKKDEPSIWQIVARTVAALALGYVLTYILTAALSLALFRAGWASRPDAANISTNLAFLAFPAVVIWLFSQRRLIWALGAPSVATILLAFLTVVLRL